MRQRSAFLWFDLCRFVAAMFVVLEHARDLIWVEAAQAPDVGILYKMVYMLTGFGHEAVIIFFILSGFWITSTIDRRRHLPHFFSHYMVDRLTRLLIVLVPALVIGGSLVGYTAYIYILGHAPTAKVSTYAYVNPVVAVFLGWLVLGEKIDRYILAGSAIVIASVILVTSASVTKKKETLVAAEAAAD